MLKLTVRMPSRKLTGSSQASGAGNPQALSVGFFFAELYWNSWCLKQSELVL